MIFPSSPIWAFISSAAQNFVFGNISDKRSSQILLAHNLPKETVTAIMMLYKNTKVTVRSSDGNTDVFNILQGSTQAPYMLINLPILRSTNVNKTNKSSFTMEKGKKRNTSSKNYYWCRLYRWSSSSCKYTSITCKSDLL